MKDKPIFLKADTQYPRTDYSVSSDANACVAGSEADQNDFCITASEVFMVTSEIPEDATPEEKKAAIETNVQNMQTHLYNEGPLVVVFAVPEDFSNYDGNTIYQAPEGFDYTSSNSWHAVELVGWGKDAESGQKYWVCRNSWGDKWPVVHKKCNGMGFFYIAMGKNECAIENYAAGITPKIINANKAPRTANDVYPGEGACTMGRGFFSTPIVGSITWGQVIVVAAVAGVGYYMWRNHKKTGNWTPEYVRKLLA